MWKVLLKHALVMGALFLGAPSVFTQDENLKFEANLDWKVVNMSDSRPKPGGALDLSAVSAIEMQEGRLPRLVVGPSGRLAAEKRPNIPVRLRGFTVVGTWTKTFLGKKEWTAGDREAIDEFARSTRAQGYNFYRIISADAISPAEDMSIEPKLMERLDYLLAQMGRQGVYMHLTICAYANYLSAKNKGNHRDRRARMYLGDPSLLKAFEYGASAILNHVNPYTGLAWKDDPAIACVEFYNEMEGALIWSGVESETIAAFSSKFQSWLKTKYGTIEKLRDAWGERAPKAFEQVEVPQRLLAGVNGFPGAKDFVLFCNDLSQKRVEWFEDIVRRTGYKGLTGQYDLSRWLGDCAVRFEKSQVALMHKYFCHPYNLTKVPPGAWGITSPGAICRQNSSIGDFASYWCAANASRFADRPFFVTEFNHAFWNQYQHECGILFGAYSAFQGVDAIAIHSDAVKLPPAGANHPWAVGNNPVALAGEFLAGCLYLRGDVKTTQRRVDIIVPRSALASDKTFSVEQGKLALLTGLALDFDGLERPNGLPPAKHPDMAIPLSGGADVVESNGWSVDFMDMDKSQFSIDACLSAMKGKGIIPVPNISDPSKGIFQSDTGEITMRAAESLLKVCTPRSEAVSLESGKGERVGLLDVIETSTRACIAVCAMDGQRLAESKRIVLIYSTETANSGMELSPDRTTLVDIGGLPVLMKVGKLNARLENSNSAKMSFYALGIDGTRKERISLKRSDSLLEIRIDTALLQNGPTPFFELSVE